MLSILFGKYLTIFLDIERLNGHPYQIQTEISDVTCGKKCYVIWYAFCMPQLPFSVFRLTDFIQIWRMVIQGLFCHQIPIRPFRLNLKHKRNLRYFENTKLTFRYQEICPKWRFLCTDRWACHESYCHSFRFGADEIAWSQRFTRIVNLYNGRARWPTMLLKVAQYPITCQKGLEYWTKMGHLKCLEKSSKTNQVKHRPGKPVVGDSTSLVNLGTAKYQVLTVYILHWGT